MLPPELFHPKSVAVLGASRNSGKVGHGVFTNLVQSGYPGNIYGVNPSGGKVFGRHVYRDIGAMPVDPVMYSVSVAVLAENLSASVASGGDRLDTMIERFCVGAMDVEGALRVFRRIPRKADVAGGASSDSSGFSLTSPTPLYTVCVAWGPVCAPSGQNSSPFLSLRRTLWRFSRIWFRPGTGGRSASARTRPYMCLTMWHNEVG